MLVQFNTELQQRNAATNWKRFLERLDNQAGGISIGGGSGNNSSISKENTFTSAIVFDVDQKYFNQYTQSGALVISLDSNTNGQASYIYTSILTDGNNISFPSDWTEIKNDYTNDVAIYGLAVFFDGLSYQYQIYKIKDFLIFMGVLNLTQNTNNLIRSTGIDLWDSNARTVERINGVNGDYLQWEMTDVIRAFGAINEFGSAQPFTNTESKYSFFVFSNTVYLWENDVQVGSVPGYDVTSERFFRMEIIAGAITYRSSSDGITWNTLYTSIQSYSGLLECDFGIRDDGDINNVIVNNT